MDEKQKIDNYFERVRQNPPLMDIEKVHQIITEAKVEVKVEKGRRNFLRFTIMTTIFAIIISTFLFWPKAPEEISNSKSQRTNSNPEISGQILNSNPEISGQIPKAILQTADSLPLSEQKETTIKEDENATFFNDEVKGEIIETKRTINQFVPVGFVLSNESHKNLSKFEIDLFDTPDFDILRNDYSLWLSIKSLDNKELALGEYIFSPLNPDKRPPMSFSGAYIYPEDSILKITDGKLWIDSIFSELCISYELTFEDDVTIKMMYNSSIGSKNENSLERISNNEQEPMYPEQILDSTIFIELTREELETLGFKINNDAIELSFLNNMFTSYLDSTLTFGVIFEDVPSQKGADTVPSKINFQAEQLLISNDTFNLGHSNGEVIPMLVTDEKGGRMVKISIPEPELKLLFSKRFEKDIKTLLPVKMKKNTFGNIPQEDIVYWFLPTDEFFNRLPQNISKELFGEYEYITAEDKSTFEKPECKYFDECSNTLDVSNFKVFPNPASTKATVSFTLNEDIVGRISLVDLAGRERQVLHPQTGLAKGSHSVDVDISNTPEGIYLIALYSDKGVQVQRFIVAR
ncbi:MAG TPA: T9SS type A sorting domain-containing protein [Prolixibacteraceae bacterium]|nr:T9SS type A sorting domain-containing protein [Prolixibacteraceae bacterium]